MLKLPNVFTVFFFFPLEMSVWRHCSVTDSMLSLSLALAVSLPKKTNAAQIKISASSLMMAMGERTDCLVFPLLQAREGNGDGGCCEVVRSRIELESNL